MLQLTGPWRVALAEAWTAFRMGSLPIGAAIVSPDGTIVGAGRNRIFEGIADQADAALLFGHRLAHAEMNALVSVDHANVPIRECVLYTTLEPCALCVGAVRMLGMKHIHYAARDPAAGSLALLEATAFMRQGGVRAELLGDVALEGVLVALNVAAQLSLEQRLGLKPALASWESAGLPGLEFGRALFASGELQILAESQASIDEVVPELIQQYETQSQHDVAIQHHQPVVRAPLVLIVTGAPASGKSTLGRELARRLQVPFLSKDLFKEVLFDHLGWSNREWSRRLGGASMALLYRSAGALLAAGQSVALEANFYAEWDTPELLRLASVHSCRFVQVVCSASGATLVERYRRRATTGERHPGHTESEPLEETLQRLLDERWDALDLEGPVFTVSTEQNLSEAAIDALEADIRQATLPRKLGGIALDRSRS